MATRQRRLRLEPLEDRRLLAAAPLHVDIDSTAPKPDGSSWATAYVSLQDALDRAATLNADADPDNNIDQIWIAEGTYIPTALTSANPRSATFSLVDGVSLVGGFEGNESRLDQREPSIDGRFPNETILSGDLAGNDAPDIPTADLYDDATRVENAETVVRAYRLNEPITLNGLTITGGCIYGGILNYYSSPLTVADSIISRNSAVRGGGVQNHSSTMFVTNSTISGNSAWHYGGGIDSDSGTMTVTNSTISGNVVRGSGGGVYGDSSTTIVVNSTIAGNAATYGGGIYHNSGSLTVANSIVAINHAASDLSILGSLEPESGFNLIDVDPGFARNPGPGADGVWRTADDVPGDLRLRFDSPALDAGSRSLLPADTTDRDHDGNTTEPIPLDLVGNIRVEGNEVDIGSREGIGEVPWAVIAATTAYSAGHADVLFDGSGSYDPEDEPLTYQWRIDLDGNGRYDDPGETVSTAASFDYTFWDSGPHYIQLTVSDGEYSHTNTTRVTLLASPILFVDDDATPGGDGTEWSSAFNSLQAALDMAALQNADLDASNDVTMIWIAEGTYVPTVRDGHDPKSPSFTLVDGASLIGGFAGNEIRIDQREPAIDGTLRHETILSGDLAGNDAPGVATSDLREDATRDDNARAVVIITELDEPMTLDGLTITGGDESARGGGIHSVSSTLTIANSTISGNTAMYGGGIYSHSGILNLINSTISGNATSAHGAAIYGSDAELTIMNSTVSGNVAGTTGGGIIHSGSGSLAIANSTISGNVAEDGGGGINNEFGLLTITNSIIINNSADSGGGIWSYGPFIVTNSTISGNTASNDGGGLFNDSGTAIITNSTISGNLAKDDGGGIYNDRGKMTVTNSIVAINHASSLGHNVYGSLEPESAFNLIDVDPGFARDPGPGGDTVWRTPDDGASMFRLRCGSPGIDAASHSLLPADTTDLDGDGDTTEPIPFDVIGNPRIDGDGLDIGAYEVVADIPGAVIATTVAYNVGSADITFDGPDPTIPTTIP